MKSFFLHCFLFLAFIPLCFSQGVQVDQVTALNLAAKDLVYDPNAKLLYASVPAPDNQAGSIVPINPATGAAGDPIPVGIDPGQLVISEDGHSLYLTVEGRMAIQRVNLQTKTPDLRIEMGSNSLNGRLRVADMRAVPGQPGSLAVLRLDLNPLNTVTIYDNGVARPKVGKVQSDIFGFDGASRIVAFSRGTSNSPLETLTVDASGAAAQSTLQTGRESHYYQDVKVSGGHVFFSFGEAWDTTDLHPVASYKNLSYHNMIEPDVAHNRVFFVTGTDPNPQIFSKPKIVGYDLGTGTVVGSLALPDSVQIANLPEYIQPPGKFLRWGENGLAIRTETGIYLTRTSMIPVSSAKADLAVTLTESSDPVPAQTPMTLTVKVANSGPDAAAGLTVTYPLTGEAAFVSAQAAQGTVTHDAGAVRLQLDSLAAGAQATLTLNLSPVNAGRVTHSVTVSGGADDPLPGNNAALESTTVTGGAAVPVDTIRAPANNLIYDPSRKRFLLATPGSAPYIGNSILPLDPVTGSFGIPIPVGHDPFPLALSDDQRTLYVGLNGDAAVRSLDLQTGAANPPFGLGEDEFFGPLYATDLAVSPGQPGTVAAVLHTGSINDNFKGIAVFDNGVRRPTTIPSADSSSDIVYSSTPGELFSYDGLSSLFEFRRNQVDASGITEKDATRDLLSGFTTTLRYEDGRIYGSDGSVVDPAQLERVGQFRVQATSQMALDTARRRAYFLSGEYPTYRLWMFDMGTYAVLGGLRIPLQVEPDQPAPFYLFPPRLHTWGEGGTAFYYKDRLYLTSSPIPTRFGDLNEDGEVNVLDVILSLRFAVQLDAPTDRQWAMGDVSPARGTQGRPIGDDKLNVDDSIRILRVTVGLDQIP